MKIGINAYEAVMPRFGFNKKTGLPNRVGSGEFCFQLLSALAKLDKLNDYFIFSPLNPSKDMPSQSEKWKYIVFQSKKLWTLWGLSKRFFSAKEKIEVFFSPTHYLPLYTSCSSVISILDVSYIYFPKLFKKRDLYQLKLWGGYSIKKAEKIITISNSTKNDIIKTYKVSADKIAVVYPGIKKVESEKLKLKSMQELSNKFEISPFYILFVGTLQPRKNVVKLVEAFSKLKKNPNTKNLELVIVGKKGWLYEDTLSSPKKFGVEKQVKFLDFVEDEDLPSLYKNALCFVLPSLYEGFGLPVLEAMQYGCPVLTSNVSSLPEAGGDAAVYFDPQNADDIAQKIDKVISDDKLREEMIQKGYNQIKKFSWEKTAKETLRVLEGMK